MQKMSLMNACLLDLRDFQRTKFRAFSRGWDAGARRKEQSVVGLLTEKEEDIQCLQEYSEREDMINTVNEEINFAHPICFESYDLCERYHTNTHQEFNVATHG